MSEQSLAENVVNKMFDSDWFSQWLGIERVEIKTGYCVLRMKIRKEMLNGFAIAHGGITYSLADSALAFASNSHGRMSVSIETSISHTIALKEGDEITAIAEELNLTNKIGIYQVTVTNQVNETVALFKGTVYRTSKDWEVTDKRIDTNLQNGEHVFMADDSKEDKDIPNKLIFPELSYKIIGAAFEVYNSIGGNHKEIVYQKALFEVFKKNGMDVEQQVFSPVKMQDSVVGKNYFDFLIENKIVVEIKSSENFSKSNFNQLLNYLIVSKLKLGLLISFGRNEVKYKRVLNIDLLNSEKSSQINH